MPLALKIFIVALKWVVILALVGWGLWRLIQRSEDPVRLIVKLVITAGFLAGFVVLLVQSESLGIMVVPFGAVCGIGLAITWASSIGALLASPISSAFDGGDQEIEPQPFYSIAEGNRKAGKYAEAIAEIENELAKFPGDFTGQLLLAEVHAENLHDLVATQAVIDRLVAQGGHPPRDVAHALQRLSEWQLRLGQNREAAQQALERVQQLYPESEWSNLAAQRIAHLSGEEMIAAKRVTPRIALPHGEESVGLREGFAGSQPPVEDPAATAARYVEHLEQHPLDGEAREKLAQIYATHYARLDLATEQLELLLAHPNQPPKQVAHWLNLLADLHLQHAGDLAAARQFLQRLADLYPKSAAAENALHRIAYLKLEVRGQQKSQALKLGSYEQNIGLK